MKYLLILFIALVLFNCNEKEAKAINAEEIINKSITASGVKKLDNAVISFDFRDKHYEAGRYGGNFVMKRQFIEATDTIIDYLSNKNFERRVNGSLIAVQDSLVTLYSASINSVHYFAVLPYGLDGKAVNKKYLDSVNLKGQMYHKIKVTFSKDGGGEDFEDIFIYWVNTETSKIEYLAYSYNEDDGKGLRFREAYNERTINEVRFVDYNNYKPKNDTVNLEDLDELFVENKLEFISKIELETISVN